MDRIGPEPEIRPRPTIGRRLDAMARASFPLACTLSLMLLTAVPFGFRDQAQLLPAITLACIWFWSLFRPASVPSVAVFLVGLLLDLLGYLPLGVGTLTLLLAHALALRWRLALLRRGFVLVWLTFVLVAAGAAALGWALTSLLLFHPMPVGAAMFQAGLSGALYAGLASLFMR